MLLVFLGVASGLVVAMVTPPSYVSTATIFLRWVGPNADTASTANMRFLSDRAPTYALFVARASVIDRAAASSGVQQGFAELASHVEAEVSPVNSQTISVKVHSSDPDGAMTMANAFADALVEEIALEDGDLSAGTPRVDAVVAVRASMPTSTETPRRSLYVAVGALGGGVLGLLAVLVVNYLDARARPRRGLVERPTPLPTRKLGLGHLTWATMIAATIPWRSNTFYESGADPVVLAKAALSLLALGIAGLAYQRAPLHHRLPATPILILTLYFAITVVGGLANHDLAPSLVVTSRVVLLMITITLLVASYGPEHAMRSLVHVMAFVALIAALSGLPRFSGRLGGVVPPLNPNALALITAVVAIWLVAKIMAGKDSHWELFAVAGCLGIILLTGSRSTLAAVAAAAILMCLRITELRKATLAVMAIGLPFVTYLTVGTDTLQSIFLRGGSEQVSTLSNRTIAWEAALNLQRDGWQTWFGQGLAHKKISVPGQWWDTQLLDSSWVSALVQGGNLGAGLALVLGISTIVIAAFSSRAIGAAWLGFAIFTTLGGILESGLFDGSLQFMVFTVTSLGAFSGNADSVAFDRGHVRASAPRALNERLELRVSPVTQLT